MGFVFIVHVPVPMPALVYVPGSVPMRVIWLWSALLCMSACLRVTKCLLSSVAQVFMFVTYGVAVRLSE